MFAAIKNIPATDENIWIAQRCFLTTAGITAAAISGGPATALMAFGFGCITIAVGLMRGNVKPL